MTIVYIVLAFAAGVVVADMWHSRDDFDTAVDDAVGLFDQPAQPLRAVK